MQDQDQKDCQHISEMLSAFRDMELSLEEVEMVENHLSNCENCRHELAAIEMVVDKLKSLPEVAPKDFADAIEARILAASATAAAKQEPGQKPALAVVSSNVRPLAPTSGKNGAFRVKALAAVAAVALFGFVAAANIVPKQPLAVQSPEQPVVASRVPNGKLESEKGGAALNDDIVALYDEEGGNSVTDAGISTNEDGLYAIKM